MIYFITDGKFIKIGFTESDDITNRMASLQIGNARPLKLLGTIPGSITDETFLQNLLDDFRINGEWFDLNLNTILRSKNMVNYTCGCGKVFHKSRSYNAHRRHCQVEIKGNVVTEAGRIYENGSQE